MINLLLLPTGLVLGVLTLVVAILGLLLASIIKLVTKYPYFMATIQFVGLYFLVSALLK
jgi:hypothetical protein